MELFETPRAIESEIPGVNAVVRARSLARMYAVLSMGGTIDDTYVVSRKTVREIGRIQNRGRDRGLQLPLFWRMGYHWIATTWGIHPHAFGHIGYGGSIGWCDPTRQLAFGFILNRLAATPFNDARLVQLSGATVRAADARSGVSPLPVPEIPVLRILSRGNVSLTVRRLLRPWRAQASESVGDLGVVIVFWLCRVGFAPEPAAQPVLAYMTIEQYPRQSAGSWSVVWGSSRDSRSSVQRRCGTSPAG